MTEYRVKITTRQDDGSFGPYMVGVQDMQEAEKVAANPKGYIPRRDVPAEELVAVIESRTVTEWGPHGT